jgi:hypothetical protein
VRVLAERLGFTVEDSAGRFTLLRTVDVPEPVREEHLTLSEAEDLLATWNTTRVIRAASDGQKASPCPLCLQ